MLEIAGELGVTEPRISQLRAEALVLLRDRLDAAPAATAPARRRDRFGGAFTGLKPRSGNGFA